VIVGIGLDVVEMARIESALTRYGERFERRVFTPAERAACRDRVDRARALASRFAAKEACLKALGTGWAQGLTFLDVELGTNGVGAPELRLLGPAAERAGRMGVRRVHVSVSHEAEVAASVVVLEG
jgi:holo-[acyl-carrier protein] synthase